MPRIVVIDDSLTIRKLIGLSLERAGYEVVLAGTGNEGLACAARDVPDLVMLDFRLPDLTADEVCARLARDPSTSRVPVILMSARDDDVRSSMKSSGNAVDFLPKPFNASVVVARVQQALAARASSPGRAGPAALPAPVAMSPSATRPALAPTAATARPTTVAPGIATASLTTASDARRAGPATQPGMPLVGSTTSAGAAAGLRPAGSATQPGKSVVASGAVSTPTVRPLPPPAVSPTDDQPTPVTMPASVREVATTTTSPRARAFPVWPFAQKEQLARVLFTKLRGKLALLPQALPQLGDNPAGEIAKRLFTIDTIDTLIDALQPLFEANARPAPNVLTGTTSAFRLDALLRVLADEARDGEVRLQQDGLDTVLFLQSGLLVLVSTTSPSRYMEGLALDVGAVAPDVMQRATAEQARTGKPVPLSLAESGVAIADVASVVQQRGLSLLRAALERAGSYTFTPTSSLPAFANEYARPVTLEQLKLEDARANQAIDDVASWSARIFTRAPGFSRRVRRVRLDATERKVGGAVDGRVSAQSIAGRIGEPIDATVLALRRLQMVGLVDEVAAADGPKPLHVVVVGERPEFSEALRTGMAQHRLLGSYRVVSPAEVDSVGEGCDLMVIGALDAGEVDGVVSRVRAKFNGAIAVLRAADAVEPMQHLLDLGATAVLSKPVHMPTLCSLV
jgi:DNA-binding response OmpR family regulator